MWSKYSCTLQSTSEIAVNCKNTAVAEFRHNLHPTQPITQLMVHTVHYYTRSQLVNFLPKMTKWIIDTSTNLYFAVHRNTECNITTEMLEQFTQFKNYVKLTAETFLKWKLHPEWLPCLLQQCKCSSIIIISITIIIISICYWLLVRCFYYYQLILTTVNYQMHKTICFQLWYRNTTQCESKTWVKFVFEIALSILYRFLSFHCYDWKRFVHNIIIVAFLTTPKLCCHLTLLSWVHLMLSPIWLCKLASAMILNFV